MSTAWAKGSTAHWRTLRAAVLAANRLEHGGRCQLNVGHVCQRHGRACPHVCTGMAEQVHHARGKENGDDPRYLVPSCKACNLHVGQPRPPSPAPRPVSDW